jgi:uridine kinase
LRTGLPTLCLDDFYKDSGDPSLPRRGEAVDWDSPGAWDGDAGMAAVEELARTGSAEVPAYSISASRAIGNRTVTIGDSRLFIAEGIFAAELAPWCQELGLLASAYALHRPRPVTFVRRLARDLSEHRKPAPVLIRRGLWLYRNDRAVLARQVALGCVLANGRQIRRAVSNMPA